ncbi:hypothetical protein [Polaribacter uvawellassae]|uniref:hypothetical protein n=1 Tax=Polaribacter uvawellassae TaxID=3133495 RepID=UPI00321BA2CE
MRNLILCFLLSLNFNSFSQEQKKDSLFIKLDKKYLEITEFHKSKGFQYYSLIQDRNHHPEDWFYFSEEKIIYNLKPIKIFNIIEVLKKANAFYQINKYDEFDFYQYLEKKYDKIFLITKNRFIQVDINYFIE